MKYLIYTWALFAIVSCQKDDENALNEYDLFGRLQAGEGVWKIESYEILENNVENPESEYYTVDDEFLEFYILTKEISGSLVDIPSVNIYKGNALTTSRCEAELERVVFNGSGTFGGIVYTVTENKRKKQVWTYVEGTTVSIMTLTKCNCELPDKGLIEGGG